MYGMMDSSKSLGSAHCSNPSPGKISTDVHSVFLCKTCNAVLGDGQSVCENNDSLNCIALLRVTRHVKVNTTIDYSLNGELKGCAYYTLNCDCCKANIGLSLHSATSQQAYLLQLFCLFKDQISCYLFKTQKVVEGNNVHFDLTRYSLLLNDLQVSLCSAHDRIEMLSAKRQAARVTQNQTEDPS